MFAFECDVFSLIIFALRWNFASCCWNTSDAQEMRKGMLQLCSAPRSLSTDTGPPSVDVLILTLLQGFHSQLVRACFLPLWEHCFQACLVCEAVLIFEAEGNAPAGSVHPMSHPAQHKR